MKCKRKDVRGGHADTKEDREIKKDAREDEKEKARGLPHSASVLVLKKKANTERASRPSAWIYLFYDADIQRDKSEYRKDTFTLRVSLKKKKNTYL